jgi:hypothetical protein
MRTIVFNVTDFGPFSERVGELSFVNPDVNEDDLVGCGKRLAEELLQQQPEMLHRGMCLIGSDETGTVRFITAMGRIH